MHASIHNEEVVGAPDLGVRVDNALSIVGSAHLSGSKVMATTTDGSHESLRGGVLGNGKDAVGFASPLEQLVNEGSKGFLVAFGVHEGVLGHVGRTAGRDLDGTSRSGAVGQVDLDANGVIAVRANSALNVTGSAIGSVDAGPKVQTLTSLGHETAALSKEVNGLLVRVSPGSLGERNELLLGGEGDGRDAVVLEVLADGEVDPLLLGRQLDVGGAGGDDFDLLGGADAGVEEDARGGVGAGGEDERSTLAELNDLAGSTVVLDLDAGDEAAVADGAEDHGVEFEGEVGEGFGVREDRADGAVAQTVSDLGGIR